MVIDRILKPDSSLWAGSMIERCGLRKRTFFHESKYRMIAPCLHHVFLLDATYFIRWFRSVPPVRN